MVDKNGQPPYETNFVDDKQANSTLKPPLDNQEPSRLLEMQRHIDSVIFDIHARHYHSLNTEYPYASPNASRDNAT